MRSGNFTFIIKTSTLYGILAAVFSLVGLSLSSTTLVGNPLEVSGISIEHIIGHIAWGLIIGLVTFRLKYFLIAGIFPIILDSDHLIQFLGIEVVPRMAHSVSFGLIAILVMMMIFGKRDYLLGVISFAAVLSHISFDIIISGTTTFPLFAPFTTEVTTFQGLDWVWIQIGAVILVGISVLISRRKKIKKEFRI
jgi:hypothetical protein